MQLLERNVVIDDIIGSERVTVHFQPIISIKKKAIIGVEALCRGIDADTSEMIPPNILFDLAKEEGLTIDLDRLCRKKALESYGELYFENSNLILFLNIDTSIIDNSIVGSGHLLNMVNQLSINPSNVVIEIVESKVSDLEALKRFVEIYKNHGFLIALDDVGSGHSNLDRIPLVKPDVLKVDRNIINDIDKKYYKQEVFKSLVNLSKKIGALVVAEGVEREEEAIIALELGADMLQGFYFAKPQNYESIASCIEEKIFDTAVNFKSYMVERINYVKSRHRGYNIIVNNIINELSNVSIECFDRKLNEMINKYPILECIYVLDQSGMQVSDTFCNRLVLSRHKRLIYSPAKKDTDHTLKDYYYLLANAGLNRYTTEPYISLASGNLCITISSLFENVYNNYFILCVDINPDYLD